MGMAASQARLLSITSRLSDNELRAQIINNNKMRLATESSQASEAYISALNDAQYMFSNYDANNNINYQPLTFKGLTSYNPYNNQYALINSGGKLLISEIDARNYESSENLDEFLECYGLEKDTTYFDNLKTDASGNVLYAYYDDNGTVAGESAGFTPEQLKAAYYGKADDTTVIPMKGTGGMPASEFGYDNTLNSIKMYDYVTNLSIYTQKKDKFNQIVLPEMNKKLDEIVANRFGSRSVKTYDELIRYLDGTYDGNGNRTSNQAFSSWSQLASMYGELAGLFSDGTMRSFATDDGVKFMDDAVKVFNNTDKTYKKEDTVSVNEHWTERKPIYGRPDPDDDPDAPDVIVDWEEPYLDYYYSSSFSESIRTMNFSLKWPVAPVNDNKVTVIYSGIDDQNRNVSGTIPTNINRNTGGNFTTTIAGAQYEFYIPAFNETSVTVVETLEYTIEEKTKLAQNILSNFRADLLKYWEPTSQEFIQGAPENFKDILDEYIQAGNDLYKVIYGTDGPYSTSNLEGPPPLSELDQINDLYNYQGSTPPGKTGTYPSFEHDFNYVYMNVVLDNVMDTYGEPTTTWINKEDPNDNSMARMQWYTNLYNRIKASSYTVLKDGLASSSEWIKFAFESGLVTMEQVDSYNEWNQLSYTNCSDITQQTDNKAVTIAEAEYNAAMNKIENKDKRYDLELKNIDTEHNSLQTEYDSIKAALDKNIERNFKLFG